MVVNLWCGGWASNPRRPTPPGPECDPVNSSLRKPVRDLFHPTEEDLRDFLSYCLGKGNTETVCTEYVRQLRSGYRLTSKNNSTAWKAYFKYIGRLDLWREVKVKKTGVDLYVPEDGDVVRTLRVACEISVKLCWTYKILAYSGIRLIEATTLLSKQDPGRWIRRNGFWKYPLSWMRGPKNVFYVYTVEKPPRINVSSKWVTNWASHGEKTAVRPKYMRKWVATKMISLGIPEEIVNFIQGRIPQSILARHYLNLTVLADKYYPRYRDHLRELGFPVGTVEAITIPA